MGIIGTSDVRIARSHPVLGAWALMGPSTYWMISVAWARTDGGIVRAQRLRVPRLITRSNFVRPLHWHLRGIGALQNPVHVAGRAALQGGAICAVGDQSAGRHHIAERPSSSATGA